MKKLIILCAIVISANILQAQWFPQNSGIITEQFYTLYFLDKNNGWVAGTNGIILRTSDGGENWQQQMIGLSKTFFGISFANANYGIAVGYQLIRYSIDGGVNWMIPTSTPPLTIHLRDVESLNASKAIAVGGSNNIGQIWLSTDAGANWQMEISPGNKGLISSCFIDANTGAAVGFNTIIRTTDGGATWTEQSFGTEYYTLVGVSFPDENNGTAIGTVYVGVTIENIILKTTNGGVEWIETVRGMSDGLQDVFFIDRHNGWTVGAYGTILVTADGGETWIEQASGTTKGLWGVIFTDINNGWIIGEEGTILHTTNGGGTFAVTKILTDVLAGSQTIDVFSNEGFSIGDNILINPGGENEEVNVIIGFGSIMLQTPLQFNHMADELIRSQNPTSIENNFINMTFEYILLQNYPNPFNPSTTIKFQIPDLSFVTMKVYDVLGNEIATLINEEKPIGNHEVEFDASTLPSGIYFYRIQAGRFIETKKMILLR